VRLATFSFGCGVDSVLIYSRKSRVLFTHVSRTGGTGGTAIADCLRRSLPDSKELLGQHEPPVCARSVLGELFDRSFKFAFVRNPWDRFVSWYALIGRSTHTPETEPASLVDPESEHWKGFDAFLENWSAETALIDGALRRRLGQWDQLADADGQLLTDDVGRFETLAEDADRLFAKAGIDCPSLPTMNSSRHHHYSLYYSDFGRELVDSVFRRDVEQFGYRFEEPRGSPF
jgi:hypothetical protein